MKKRLISVIISLVILGLVYAMADPAAIGEALAQTDLTWLALSLVLLVALIFLSALRLYILSRAGGFEISERGSVEATFAANALNLVIPGKLGNLLKASLMAEKDSRRLPLATALGAWEKLSDLTALFAMAALPTALLGGRPLAALALGALALGGFAALMIPQIISLPLSRLGVAASLAREWGGLVSRLKARPGRLALSLGLTLLLWLGHLAQILLMAAALGVSGDATLWASLMAMIPVAIVAGLAPLTFAGVGTRDAVLVALAGGLIGAGTAAALGVLFWLRYIVPGLIGIPLLPKFLRVTNAHRKGFSS